MTERPIQEIKTLGRSLRSNLCPACGGRKRARQSFCRTCFGHLTPTTKAGLYQRFGEGYEDEFDRALDELGIRSPHFPEVSPS